MNSSSSLAAWARLENAMSSNFTSVFMYELAIESRSLHTYTCNYIYNAN